MSIVQLPIWVDPEQVEDQELRASLENLNELIVSVQDDEFRRELEQRIGSICQDYVSEDRNGNGNQLINHILNELEQFREEINNIIFDEISDEIDDIASGSSYEYDEYDSENTIDEHHSYSSNYASWSDSDFDEENSDSWMDM